MPVKKKSEIQKPVVCAACGHAESEHGLTGTRPCLAVAGDLREFCVCDVFRAAVQAAATAA